MRRTVQRAAAAMLTAALALGGVVALGVAPANATTTSFRGTLTSSDAQWSWQIGCSPGRAEGTTVFDAQPFSVTAPGTYAVRMTQLAGVDATFHLFEGSFSPVSTAGCIAYNDDYTGLQPGLDVSLQPGRQYVLVTSPLYGSSTQVQASYTTEISGPGDTILGSGVPLRLRASQSVQSAVPLTFSATFAQAVTGFDASDVSVIGAIGSPSVTVTGSGADYQIAVTGTNTSASGNVAVSIAAGAASNGSLSSVAASAATTYAPRPSVTIQQSTTQADAATSLPISFDVQFSEAVTGFVAADVVVTGTAGGGSVTVAGSGSSYVVRVADAQRPGTVEVAVPANVAQTAFGARNLEATSTDRSVTFLPSAPVATIAPSAATTPTVPVRFSVDFDGAVQGFDASDVLVGGTAGASGVSVSGSGATYVVAIADAARAGTVTAQVRGDAVTRYSSTNAASATATATFAPPRPSVTVEQSAAQSDPTVEPTAVFDVTFSEPVTGLTASDLVVGGTAGASTATVSGSGSSYVATVTGATRPGTITVTVPEGAAASLFEESSLASTSVDGSVAFEPLAPTVVVTLDEGQDATTSTSSAAFRLTFSEPVSGLGVDDLVIDSIVGGAASIEGPDGGSSYLVRVDGLERAGTVTVSVRAEAVEDAYGLANAASNAASVTFAPVRPTVTVDQSTAQADPAGADGFAFDVIFSQPVTGLDASDLVIGGTAGATTVMLVGDGATYVATVSGATQPGSVTLTLPEGAALGAFETASLASTSIDAEVTFAPPAPTVTVEQAAFQEDPASFGFLAFDVTFSHDVAGLAPESFVVGGSAGASSVLLEGSGSSYRAYVSDMVRPGTVTLALAAGAATDRYGLTSLASTSVDATIDFQPPAPTASIARADGQSAVTNAEPFVFDVSFSVPVSGFDAEDVVVDGDTGASIVEVVATPQSGGGAVSAALATAAADELGYDWTVRVSGATSYGVVAIGIREGAVVSGYGLTNAAVASTVDGAIVYAPAVVAPTPIAPLAPAPVAPAPAAALPQTAVEPLWACAVAAMLVLAAGIAVRRRARRG